MLVAAVVFSTGTAEAAITKTLKYGMKDAQVKELQQNLNAAGFTVSTSGAGSVGYETTSFGTKTKLAVQAYQTSKGLTADGVFGPASRAAWTGGSTVGLPAGCTSTSGFSPISGVPCSSGGSTLPAGCTSTTGFSSTTGLPCSGTTSQTGPVTASLSSNNPAASTLVAGQATANLANFTFSGSGTVTKVTLQRIGVSADTTPSNVYLFDGATRLTDAASVSNTGTVTFTAPAGLFTVNGTKTISVRSDILGCTAGTPPTCTGGTSTSGQTVGMMLATFTTSSGTTTANLSGNIHSIASATLATVSAPGTVTPSGATLNPGANQTVWQSTLTISNRDVWMKRFALRNIGSAPASAFANFKLFVNGTQVSTATSLDASGYVTFDMNSTPVLLASGSRVIRVDADIVSGASRTVQFSLRNAADADFVDSSFGVNVTPSTTFPWQATTANVISGTAGGTLTIEKDVSSPSANLTNGANDQVLGVFKLTAFGEPMKIETLRVAYTGSANIDDDDDALRNARIMIGGAQYGSTASLNETTDGTLAYTTYTLNYTVNPGTPVLLEVRSDVYDSEGTNDIVAGTDSITAVIAAGSSNVQKVDSLGSVSVPGAAVSANTLTVGSTSVTLSKNSTYASQNTVLPSTAFKIGSWNLNGSSTEDVLLTTMSFDIDESTGTEFDEGDITSMYVVVKNGSTIVAQPAPIATLSMGGQDNNFSVNYTLAKNTTVTVELYANLADDGQDDTTVTTSGAADAIDAADAFTADLIVSGTASVSGSSVTSTEVTGQAIAYGTASITVSKDASSPVAAIVYDNQEVTTLATKFSAVTAGYNITDMTVTLGTNADTVVNSVALYDGATFIKSVPMTTATTAVFNGMSINVPANSSKVLTVKVTLGTIGVGAGTTGSTITTSIAAATHVVYTNTATGVSTSSSTEEAGTATGSTMYVYAAVPTVAKVELEGSQSDLLAGTKVLAKFSVTANGGTVAWKQVMLDIDKAADPTIGSVTLWDVTGGANTQVTAAYVFQNESTANSATTCDADDTYCELLISVGTNADDNVEEQVSGTKTYEVRGTIGGSLSTGEFVSTSIQSNLAHVASGVYTGVDNDTTVDDATFVWSDTSAQSHDTGTSDWVNENLVKVLPTSTWTMTYPL
jgi:peptidoglycan hydrolase-like protein with peptidoglycan-binding domain